MPEARKDTTIPIRRMRGRRLGLVLWCGGLVACAGDVRDQEASEPLPDTAMEEAVAVAAAVLDTATWRVDLTEAPSGVTAPPLPVLTALRTGIHDEWVRLTLELGTDAAANAPPDAASGRPGYRVEYVDRPLIACGSGERIFPAGDAWLEIRLAPAAAHTEQGEPTLGPRDVAVDGALLRRIYRTCDFEGIVTHVLAPAIPRCASRAPPRSRLR